MGGVSAQNMYKECDDSIFISKDEQISKNFSADDHIVAMTYMQWAPLKSTHWVKTPTQLDMDNPPQRPGASLFQEKKKNSLKYLDI